MGRLGHRHSRRGLGGLAAVSVVGLVTGLTIGVGAGAARADSGSASPTIATSQSDYSPGSTVVLTGTGWQPGDDVQVSVNATDGTTWQLDSGTGGATADPVADASGSFSYSFSLPTFWVATYSVDATGASGEATTTFTDGPANLWQCTNGGVGDTPEPCAGSQLGAINGFKNYVNGNANGQKAHWQEGEFIAYRDTMSIPGPGTYRFILNYDNVEQGRHSLDYIGSFDYTETTSATGNALHANNNDPCSESGLLPSNCDPTSPASTYPIPTATFFPTTSCGGASTGVISQIPGTMDAWGDNGPTITGVSYVSENVQEGGVNCDTTVQVDFTATAQGTTVLAWGGHIANQADWGAGNSAGAIQGSSYHMRQLDLQKQNTQGGYDSLHGVGNQDAQLATSAIYATGTLRIAKTLSNPDGGTVPATFDISYDCGTGHSGTVSVAPGSTVVADSTLPLPSTCTVSETPPSPPSGYSWSTPTYSPASTVTVDGDTTDVTVTVANVLSLTSGSLQIQTMKTHKNLFTGNFTIDYSCDLTHTGSVTVAAGGSVTVPDIPVGDTCTLSEPTFPTPPAGYGWQGPIFSPTGTPQITTAGQTVTVMVAHRLIGLTGAQPEAFWMGSTGQSIINGGSSTGGVCDSGTWLRSYAPFADLSPSATCSQVSAYVTSVMQSATLNKVAVKARLKGQMLATALNVYFSDPALGGNLIGAPAPIGGRQIDLTYVCKMTDTVTGVGVCHGIYANVKTAFGGATHPTVLAMLSFAASQSNPGGSTWYGNVASAQTMAKNAFEAINNLYVFYT
jgi:hypothetical protein